MKKSNGSHKNVKWDIGKQHVDFPLEQYRYRVMENVYNRYSHHRKKGASMESAAQLIEKEFFLRSGVGRIYCGLYETFICGQPPLNSKINDLTFKSTGLLKLAHVNDIINRQGNSLSPSLLNVSREYVELLLHDSYGSADWYDLRELSIHDVKSIQEMMGKLVLN